LKVVYGRGKSDPLGSRSRSKRQERVGHLVRSEIASIIRLGYPIKNAEPIDDELRRRISVVNVDVSPDLHQARVIVSVMGKEIFEKRAAYSWLVRSTKNIRHALAQRLNHMKTLPNLTFIQADVGAAVDVMQLIEKISKEGYKRESIELSTVDVDDEWIDEDDEW